MKIQMMGGVGALASALALMGLMASGQLGQTQEKRVEGEARGQMMRECAKACSDCQLACDACAAYCAQLMHAGKKEHLASQMTCQDCATVCSAAARIIARVGPQSALICDCCASACGQCAAACEKMPDDKHMKACAEECRKCEQACRAMAKPVASR